MTAASVVLRGIEFHYPDGHRALNGLDLEVGAGERVAVLGPNGAGKTTMVLHLNGIHRASAGEVQIGGLRIGDGDLQEVRRRVGLVFQDANDQLFMSTVAEDVAFGPANLGLSGDQLHDRVERALRAVQLVDRGDRAPHHLSGGEKRRAAIAGVLAMDPDVLVFDEPTADLDPAGRRELVDLLRGFEQTQIVVTHDLPFALELCPRSVILAGGRVVADGSTAEVLADQELLRAHRLELPYGFDPRSVRRA